MEIEIKRLYNDSILPTKPHDNDAGFDLYAREVCTWDCHSNKLVNLPSVRNHWFLSKGEHVLVKTGVAINLPPKYEAQIRPRSGLALKHGISVLNSPGTIDTGFINELGVILTKISGSGVFSFSPGDRIAQLVVKTLPKVTFVNVSEFSNLDVSERGMSGFGDSGR